VATAYTQRRQISWIPHTQWVDYVLWWSHLTGRGIPAYVAAVLVMAGLSWRGLGPPPTRALLGTLAVFGSLLLVTVSWWWPTYDTRYVIESAPAIALLVAAGVGRAANAMPRQVRLATLGGAGLAATVLCLELSAMWNQIHRPFFHENLAEAAEQLIQPPPGTDVAFLPGAARGALYYYLDRDQDGDLRALDVTALPGTSPLTAANYSGVSRHLPLSPHLFAGAKRIVVVLMGSSIKVLTGSPGPPAGFTSCGGTQLGALSLDYFCRGSSGVVTDKGSTGGVGGFEPRPGGGTEDQHVREL
jgi:hypothetical protein